MLENSKMKETKPKKPESTGKLDKSRRKKPDIRNIKAILFDLDGVLVISFDAWYHTFNNMLVHFDHKPISREQFKKGWGQSTEDDIREYLPGCTVTDVSAYLDTIYDEYAMKFLITTPYAVQMLSALKKKGLRLACVTNSHRDMTRRTLERTGLLKYLDVVISADDVRHPKPAPDMLLDAFRQLEVTPRQAIYLGDTVTDQLAGSMAKCTTVGYRVRAKYCVQDLREFLSLFEL